MAAIPKLKKIKESTIWSLPKAVKINKEAKNKVITAVTIIPFFNSFAVNSPLCSARFGPTLSWLSVPLIPSP